MKKFMLGKKIGMTQIFDEAGTSIPVTVVEAGPCTVLAAKTVADDGYVSVKVGYSQAKERSVTKPVAGVYKKLNVAPCKYMREFRVDDSSGYEVGKSITVSDMFAEGDKVDVSGISKGKGFAGTIKRHGQKRGKETHGSKFHRGVGSMGANSFPGRIFKGKNMPGHMGNERVTVQNLAVVKVDAERNLLLIRGAAPGPIGALLSIRDTVKEGR